MSEIEVYVAPAPADAVSVSEISESSSLSDSSNSSLSDWEQCELVDMEIVAESQDSEIPVPVTVTVPVEVEPVPVEDDVVAVAVMDSEVASLPIVQVKNELNNLHISGAENEIKSDESYDSDTSTSSNSDSMPELEDINTSYLFQSLDLEPINLVRGFMYEGETLDDIATIVLEVARNCLVQLAAEKRNVTSTSTSVDADADNANNNTNTNEDTQEAKKSDSLTALEIIEQNLSGQQGTSEKTIKLQRDFLNGFRDNSAYLDERVEAEWKTHGELEMDVMFGYNRNEELRKEVRHLQTELARLTAQKYSREITNN